LKQNSFSPTAAFEQCESISFDESVRSCYVGIARYMASFYFYDLEKTASVCVKVNSKYQKDCIIESVSIITNLVNPELGDDFCKLVPEKYFLDCIEEWERVQERNSSA